MAAPYSNLQSKLDRAIVAYLISVGVGTAEDTVPNQNSGEKITTNGLTVVVTGEGQPEIPGSGIYRLPVKISMKYPAALKEGVPNPHAQMVAARQRHAQIVDALRQSDDQCTLLATARLINTAGRALAVSDDTEEGDLRAENNSDMADFTLQMLEDNGDGPMLPDADGNYFESEAQFESIACAGNVAV